MFNKDYSYTSQHFRTRVSFVEPFGKGRGTELETYFLIGSYTIGFNDWVWTERENILVESWTSWMIVDYFLTQVNLMKSGRIKDFDMCWIVEDELWYLGTVWKISFWNLLHLGKSITSNLWDLEILWRILENQYLGIPLKIPTPTIAPDNFLRNICIDPSRLENVLVAMNQEIWWDRGQSSSLYACQFFSSHFSISTHNLRISKNISPRIPEFVIKGSGDPRHACDVD